jgi:hypothetical protein
MNTIQSDQYSSLSFENVLNMNYQHMYSSTKHFNPHTTASIADHEFDGNRLIDKACRQDTGSFHCLTHVRKRLGLRIAINGASKSIRGNIPLANRNLFHGDFGDDTGIIVKHRDHCFLGKLNCFIDIEIQRR